MKPKPLSSLYHFTVPVAMAIPPTYVNCGRERRSGATTAGAEHCLLEEPTLAIATLECASDTLAGREAACLGPAQHPRGSGWPQPPEPSDRSPIACSPSPISA